ncbi:DUF1127 domain-containing protein [Thiofilum flexile]|uniref:DUF1127 domain-containing protein n=1 Tax=Thiofilum flexile TaxID=125627 RepID=UPI00037A308F|nr:DUF1127 domain-containing protein [Thiofilum flexile]
MKTLLLPKMLDTRVEQTPSTQKRSVIPPLLQEQGDNKLWQIFSITWYVLIHWRQLRIRQRTRQELLDLTKEQLWDIGLTRAEVEREAHKRFWE